MGTVESKDEENSTIRFVDSVEVRHEKGGVVHGKDDLSTDYVPEGKCNVQTYKHCEIHNRYQTVITLSAIYTG